MGCGLRDQRGEVIDIGDADGCRGDAVVAVPVGEHDQLTRFVPRDAEELVGSECLGHQDAVSLVVPLDPHANTFVAGGPLVNLALDGVPSSGQNSMPSSGPAERVATSSPCGRVSSPRSVSQSVSGTARARSSGRSLAVSVSTVVASRSAAMVCPSAQCFQVTSGVVSGFGEFGGGVVVVDLSSPGPEVPDVADEIAAFAVELSALLEDGAGLLGDVVEVVFRGGDVAFSAG